MFDWFWNFLYLITKSIFRLIDGLLSLTNLLCGIEKVTINGDETDLLTWLIETREIKYGIIIASIVAFGLIIVFTIWQIIRTVTQEKPDMTPGQVIVKSIKSILTFLFIPFLMAIVIWAFNTVGEVMYNGTRGGTTGSMGSFLVGAFSQDALNSGVPTDFYAQAGFDYTDTSAMWGYFDLSDFDYFYSWVAGIALLFMMAKILFIFVERVFSIVFLYIVSPLAVSSSVVDEGKRFKNWREQILSKFIVGYGAIISLNIYAIVVSKICLSDLRFLESDFLNFLFKIVIILGGTFGLNKLVHVINNVFTHGSEEAMATAEGMKGGVKSFGKAVIGAFTKPASMLKNSLSSKGGSSNSSQSSTGSSSTGEEGGTSNSSGSTGNDGQSRNKAPTSQYRNDAVKSIIAATPEGRGAVLAVNAIEGSKKTDDGSNKNETPSATTSTVGKTVSAINTVNPDKGAKNKK